ncbi:MAG: tRNA (adenosine(37)-N6)-threonylcarbamoyltransferase complex transferase subunit TsaD [Sulfobacillus sp.]
MLVLGVETSCDETSVAVMADGAIVSLRIASQAPLHSATGGVVPETAARRHLEVIREQTEQALLEAGLTARDLDAVAYTRGPGLLGCLLVGTSFSQGLALSLGIPAVGVNHVLAHIHAAFIDQDATFPLLALVVSGGHTSLYRFSAPITAELIGETRDDAAGEALDKVARLLGLGYPGGAALEQLAASAPTEAWQFPRVRLSGARPDFSFSGVKTAARQAIAAGAKPAAVASGFQQAVVSQLVETTCQALVASDRMLVVGGGVSANQALRQAFHERVRSRPVLFAPLRLCSDNAAMIGRLGWEMLRAGIRTPLGTAASSRLDTLT